MALSFSDELPVTSRDLKPGIMKYRNGVNLESCNPFGRARPQCASLGKDGIRSQCRTRKYEFLLKRHGLNWPDMHTYSVKQGSKAVVTSLRGHKKYLFRNGFEDKTYKFMANHQLGSHWKKSKKATAQDLSIKLGRKHKRSTCVSRHIAKIDQCKITGCQKGDSR